MSEHTAVERIVTELRLLQNWHGVKEMEEETGFTQPTISKDVKGLERLGLISKRSRTRTGRGRPRMEYRLKSDEKSQGAQYKNAQTKRGVKQFTNFLTIIQSFDEHRRKGLTSAELSEKTGIPISSCYQIVSFLKDVGWLYRYGRGPKPSRPYKPKFRIVAVGEG